MGFPGKSCQSLRKGIKWYNRHERGIRTMGYQIEKLKEGLYAIDDEYGDSIYLILGEKRALLIDTGMGKEDLYPVIQSLTDLPVTVALTHAHIDHFYHAGAFETVYIHPNEQKYWRKGLWLCTFLGAKLFKVPYKKIPIADFMTIEAGESLDLGGVKVKAVEAFGHTPGSLAFVDEYHQAVFMGDAVGSGVGAWMWLPASLPLSQYRRSLLALASQLKPYVAFRFYGGHRAQENLPEARQLSLKTVEDMAELCQLVLNHQLPCYKKEKQMGIQLETYRYESGAFVVSSSKMK